MDGSAFLSLPASNFTPADDQAFDEEDESSANIQDELPNGTSGEGERRRREMLDVALTLEARYRALLPPERIRKANMNTWTEQENRAPEDREESQSQEGESSKAKETTGIKLKFKVPNPQQIMTSSPMHQTPVKKVKQAALPPPRPSPLRHATSHYEPEETPPMNIPQPSVIDVSVATVVDTSETTPVEGMETLEAAPISSPQPSGSGLGTSAPPASLPATPMSNPDIAVLETTASPDAQEDDIPLAIRLRTTIRAFKRPRLSLSPSLAHRVKEHHPQSLPVPMASARQTSVPPIESINTSLSAPLPLYVRIKQQKQKPLAQQRASQKPRQPYTSRKDEAVCLLMVAAVRSSAGTKSRNQMRHITAFGAKVPQAVDEIKEFELPYWVREEDEEEYEDEYDEDEDDNSSRRSVEQYDELEPNTMNDASPVAETNLRHSFPHPSHPHPYPGVSFLSFEPPIEVLDIPESSVRDGS